MTRKSRFLRWSVGMAMLAMADGAGIAALQLALSTPAEAQFFDQRSPYANRQRAPRSGGFFQQLFGPSRDDDYFEPPRRSGARERDRDVAPAPSDNVRAPPSRKADKDAPAPTTSVVVLGDGMADWLAYGLEDAFSDMPEVGIVRKSKAYSGLIHYDSKGDLDWWRVARDILNGEKPNYVVMMIGLNDRQNIRERDVAKEAEKKKDEAAKPPLNITADAAATDKTEKTDKTAEEGEQPAIAAPEPAKKSNGVLEFRGDQWEKIYSRRIDDTVAALRSKGVPVFWVGLPSIRGSKSTADAVYLNDLYRARAEKAGAIYVDVWDGFVDEAGKFTSFGPDYEGQVRRLRSADGVFFTKYGARKLAHYVERELRRYMSNRSLQVSLPTGPMGPVPADGKSAVRPLAGPVVPLTMTTANSDQLLGGAGLALARGDAIATGVLVKGDAVTPPRGRADNFYRTPDGAPPAPPAPPVAAAPPAPEQPKVAAVPKTEPAAGAAPVAAKPAPAPVSPAPPVASLAPAAATPEPSSIVNPEPVAAVEAKPAEPQATAKPRVRKPTVERKPEPRPELRPDPRSQRAVDNRPRPPAGIAQQRPQQPPPRRDGLFDRNGPFGWIR